MDVGDVQIYRLRDYAPSERVRVVAIDNRKKNPRYEIEFLEGGKEGTQENVPGVRLRGPWAGAAEFAECRARKADDAREFVDRAVGLDPQRVLLDPLPADETRRPIVARACVNSC